jgi:hypothetical protein
MRGELTGCSPDSQCEQRFFRTDFSQQWVSEADTVLSRYKWTLAVLIDRLDPLSISKRRETHLTEEPKVPKILALNRFFMF